MLAGKKCALKQFEGVFGESTFLLVRKEDAEEYAPIAELYHAQLLCLPQNFPERIDMIYDYACDHARSSGKTRIILSDDDVNLSRHDLGDGSNSKIDNDEACHALQSLIQLVSEDIPIAGFPRRVYSNNIVGEAFRLDRKVIQLFSLKLDTLYKSNVRFTWRGHFIQDYHIQLQCIAAGMHVLQDARYIIEDTFGTNGPGGCSCIRTEREQERAARLLHEEFPNKVKLRWKTYNKFKALDVLVNLRG